MKTFTEIAEVIGQLVTEKNAAYGSSFAKSGDYLRLLWPDGIPPDRYDDALLLVRGFDKDMRIAINKDAFGESPYADKAGYGILGVHLHQQKQQKEVPPPCPGSAKGPNVSSLSKEPLVSAPVPAKQPTMPNAKGIFAHLPSALPNGFSPKLESAAAPTAMEDANRSAAVDLRKRRNFEDHCGRPACNHRLSHRHTWTWLTREDKLVYCSESCCRVDQAEVGA